MRAPFQNPVAKNSCTARICLNFGLHFPIKIAVITENIFPRWLAPNLVTLTGLFALVVTYIVTAIYLPEFGADIPRWLYFLAGAAVVFYLNMDSLDGKQARRTKTSSPLGQLFDHGCDALAVHFILVNLVSTLQLKHEWRAVAGMLYVYVPWWMAHWEEYHTGVMVYGAGFWGVTEANYAVAMVHFYTFLVGPKGWTAKPLSWLSSNSFASARYSTHLGYPLRILGNLGINDIFLIAFGVMGFGLFLDQVNRVFKYAGTKYLERTTLPREEHGNKTLGRAAAASHLLQIVVTCTCGGILLLLPVHVPGQSRVVMATFGVIYALQATRLIMAHMSKEPFRIAIWPIALMLVQIINEPLHFVQPLFLAYMINMVVVVGYLHYVISIISEICGFLGIRALTIKAALD